MTLSGHTLKIAHSARSDEGSGDIDLPRYRHTLPLVANGSGAMKKPTFAAFQIGLLAAVVSCAELVLPRLAVAQTAPAG